ncbi:MAG: hypothetical protein ACFFB0_08525 [Promethearchaeota archaeon]
MTEAKIKNIPFPIVKKREIDWTQYLDYTLLIEAGETGNDELDKFQKDLCR